MAIDPANRSAATAHPLFGRLPEATLDALLEKAEEMKIPAGENLITEGEFNPHLFLILQGEAEVIAGGDSVSTLGPGDVAGEISTAGLSSPIADVKATRDLAVIAFPIEEINNVAFEMENFAEALRALGMRHAKDTYGEWEG
jgi:CRP-like cAMP-binding protein